MAGSTASKRKWRSRDEVARLLQRFESSALTRREFCAREGISPESMRRWRRRLAGPPEAVSAQAGGEPAFVDIGSLTGQLPVAAGFEIRLELGAGVVLHLVRH